MPFAGFLMGHFILLEKERITQLMFAGADVYPKMNLNMSLDTGRN